ncbi:MAG TPA: hypothetical protein VFP68_03595 [Burkholderiaceae bacterium]|nr:hypothetical protein [Burkholderiaceae bacterium]
MLESTELEREYLHSHKVPILQQELQVLLDELESSNGETSDFGSVKRDLLLEQLVVKAEACRLAAARLNLLEDLELRLTEFSTLHAGSDDLGEADVKKTWDDIRVDFIIAHDMAVEALSKKGRRKVREKLAMQAPDEPGFSVDPLREALHKNIDARFAKVFAHSFPRRIGYVQRGVIEVALAMFCNDEEQEGAEDGWDDNFSVPTGAVADRPTFRFTSESPADLLESIDERSGHPDFA